MVEDMGILNDLTTYFKKVYLGKDSKYLSTVKDSDLAMGINKFDAEYDYAQLNNKDVINIGSTIYIIYHHIKNALQFNTSYFPKIEDAPLNSDFIDLLKKADKESLLFTMINNFFVDYLIHLDIIKNEDVKFYQGFRVYDMCHPITIFDNISSKTVDTLGFFLYKNKYIIDCSFFLELDYVNETLVEELLHGIVYLHVPKDVEYYGFKENMSLTDFYKLKLLT